MCAVLCYRLRPLMHGSDIGTIDSTIGLKKDLPTPMELPW